MRAGIVDVRSLLLEFVFILGKIILGMRAAIIYVCSLRDNARALMNSNSSWKVVLGIFERITSSLLSKFFILLLEFALRIDSTELFAQ